MIPVTTFAGKRVAVFGLGASGTATARALAAGGAQVAAWDDGAASRAAAAQAGVPVVDLGAADWSAFSALVLAPGVPLTHPEPHWTVAKACTAGVEVIGDIELFCRERAARCPKAPFVAITGTNGKSTTTALVAHVLRGAGRDVQMGGNIGRAILTLDPPAMDRIHVIEMSSFQIDLTPSLTPTVGALLNITPDHLDRHGPADDPDQAMQAYAAIKERLIWGAQHAVIGLEDGTPRADDLCAPIYQRLVRDGRAVRVFTRQHPELSGVTYFEGGQLFRSPAAAVEVHAAPLADLAGIDTLRGTHNGQNAAAAFIICECLAVSHDAIGRELKTYPGLPHRMEQVGRAGRVVFINDSKATNADSTQKALLSWPGDMHWILGGKPKEGGITTLAPLFGRIAKAYLIGAASDAFAATLEGKVAYERCGTLDVALTRAAEEAALSTALEPVVLLSPACASYDQFRSFEHRGDRFRTLARALPGVVADARASGS
jgi:UDP-N-acetylmuramoylalanine--D-glutamate ligase